MPPSTGPRRQTLAAVLGGALLMAGLAGCSGGGGGTAAPSAGPGKARPAAAAAWPDAVPESGLAKGMVLPLEAYMETYPETVTIDRALNALQTQCMARYGFTLALPPPGTMPPPNYDDSNMARRYGITDPAAAARFAYTIGDENDTRPPAPKLSETAIAVLTGHVAMAPGSARAPSTYEGKAVPDGGCAGEAARKVGAGRMDVSLTGRLDAESLDKSQADPRVQHVISAWSRCMKSNGYTIATPLEAANLAPLGRGQRVGPASVQVATTDIACKKKTALVKTWFDVESGIQRQQVEQNRITLQNQRNRITAVVQAAAAVAG